VVPRRPTLLESLDESMARAEWCAVRMKRTKRKAK
jgi:hypothetical protein